MSKSTHARSAEPEEKSGSSPRRSDGISDVLPLAGIAILHVDSNRRIQNRTPGTETLLGIPETRIGAEVDESLCRMSGAVLIDDLHRVLAGGSPSQRVFTASGRHFLARILPSPRRNGYVAGAIISLMDLGGTHLPNTGRGTLVDADLLAIIDHDLRQPMQSIGVLNAALLQVADSANIQEIASLQCESLEQVSELLETLRDLTELAQGKTAPNPSRFPVARILDHLRDEFDGTAADRNLDFQIQHYEAVVVSDPTLMTRMLGCLISHAFRNTSRGLIHLTCASDAGDLVLSLQYTPARGRSVPADEDTGLELVIAQHVARLLAIPLERQPCDGKGTRITVRTPAG